MSLPESSNRRQSQSVSLQVAVFIRSNTPDGRCVQVQAFTSVVNAHGGLLESPLKLAINQNIRLINAHAGEEVGCRVVRVERPTSALYEIAFEFDRHSAQFWAINFTPEDGAVEEEIVNDCQSTKK